MKRPPYLRFGVFESAFHSWWWRRTQGRKIAQECIVRNGLGLHGQGWKTPKIWLVETWYLNYQSACCTCVNWLIDVNVHHFSIVFDLHANEHSTYKHKHCFLIFTKLELSFVSLLPSVRFGLHCSDSVPHAHALLWLGFCLSHRGVSVLHATQLRVGCGSALHRSGVPWLSAAPMHLHQTGTNPPRMGEQKQLSSLTDSTYGG